MAPDIELLNAVATQRYEACEAEWRELLRRLRLGLAYVPAIQAVLNEGRWKNQHNPIAYARKSAVRWAVRMGIVDIRPNQEREILASDLQFEDEDGESLGHDDKLGMALHTFEEQFGSGVGSSFDEDGFYSLEDRVPDSLMDENLEIDWERVGELAEMDAGERIVLDLQRIGFGRDAALQSCLTDDDRKFLQAAWKRFDRHRDSLKTVLSGGKARPAEGRRRVRQGHQVRLTGGEPESELEPIFIETPEGGLKISFQKYVPERQK
jgi:hypothetical protein